MLQLGAGWLLAQVLDLSEGIGELCLEYAVRFGIAEVGKHHNPNWCPR